MPNDEIKEQVIRLGDLARDVKEQKAILAEKEETFRKAFENFFNENREYVFQNAIVVNDSDEPQFRYHDIPKNVVLPGSMKFTSDRSPRTRDGRLIISCSCGSREDSCDECGDGMYSYFTVSPEAQILRMRIEK